MRKLRFFLIHGLDLVAIIFKVRHVFCVAHFLILQSLKLVLLELVLILLKDHHLLPVLEHFAQLLLMSSLENIFEASGK